MSISLEPYPTPPGFLQWFREVLAKQGSVVQLFIDPETDLEIGVFLPTLKQQITNALARRIPLPSSPQPPPSRAHVAETPDSGPPPTSGQPPAEGSPPQSSQEYGSGLDEAALTQLEQSIHIEAGPPITEQALVYKSTNKNRRRLKRLAEKKTQTRSRDRDRVSKSRRRVNRRQHLSALRVVSDSDSDTVITLQAKQPSQVVTQAPLTIHPWFDEVISKHGSLKTALQTRIRKAAMAIAGQRAVEDWQDYFQCWREKGLLTSRPTSRNQPLIRLQTLPQEIARFYYTYDEVRTSDTATSFRAITHRCRMIRLFCHYHEAESVVVPDEPPLERGQTRQAQRKRFLFDVIHPGCRGIKDIAKNEASKANWNAFTNHLRFATRWQALVEAFGYGVLGLIPESLVSNHWVQRKLTDTEFDIWVGAIRYFNPKCQAACLNWGTELARALAGRLPSRKKRALESVGEKALSGYQDPQNLFCDEVGQSGDEVQPLGLSQPMDELDQGELLLSFFGGMDTAWTDQSLELTSNQQTMLDTLNPQHLENLGVSFSSQSTALFLD